MTETTTRHGGLRLDAALVAQGRFPSRAKAQEAIDAGLVRLDGRVVRKPATLVPIDAQLEASAPYPWVSRGGVKLEAALERFELQPAGRVCLDVGASTGGFTDVLLARGARHVHAVDVGQGQLHSRIAGDARVTDWSGTDIRSLATLAPAPSLVVCDASFISLRLVLPPALALAMADCDVVALIKPQFEVGPGRTDKGIVRDAALRTAVRDEIAGWLTSALGLHLIGLMASPISGGDGNQEFLVAARRS